MNFIDSGTLNQHSPVAIADATSVEPTPVEKAPRAPYVHVWLSAPIFLNSVIAIGAVISLARTRSTFAFINSPGETSFLPECTARIFSVIVIFSPDKNDFERLLYP